MVDPEMIVRDTIEICRVAAPTGREAARARLVAGMLASSGLSVETDAAGNVVAEVPGDPARPCIAVAAHLDTVFPDEGEIQVRREGRWLAAPGIGDNSAGLAALVGLGRELPRAGLGRILLVATVGEEGLGDLRGARHLMETRGEEIDAFLALEGAMRDKIVVSGVGSERLRVTVRGPGGHSWGDAGTPSAIAGAARLVTDLYAFALPENPRTTLGVGKISGGQSVNSIAAEACFDVDLRSLDGDIVTGLRNRVLGHVTRLEGLAVETEEIGSRPAGRIEPDHFILEVVRRAREETGLPPAEEIASSTDANIPLSLGVPATCVGVGIGEDAHKRTERLRTDGLAEGFACLLRTVTELANTES